MRCAAAALLAAAGAVAENPAPGPYAVDQTKLTNEGLEPGSGVEKRDFIVTWPTNNPGKSTLVLYAHGAAAGAVGPADLTTIYNRHFKELAAYGFVVVAPTSCVMSCGIPTLGGWKKFVYENLRGADFAKNASADGDAWAQLIDFSRGVGFAGHSMGGESCVLASSAPHAKAYDIRATVVQHGYGVGVSGADVTVPLLVLTGTTDAIVTPAITKAIYTAAPRPKSFRNQKGKGHLEMTSIGTPYNPAVASHTAAFFKVWLEGDKSTYYNQIYQNSTDSLCGYAEMKECESFPN